MLDNIDKNKKVFQDKDLQRVVFSILEEMAKEKFGSVSGWAKASNILQPKLSEIIAGNNRVLQDKYNALLESLGISNTQDKEIRKSAEERLFTMRYGSSLQQSSDIVFKKTFGVTIDEEQIEKIKKMIDQGII